MENKLNKILGLEGYSVYPAFTNYQLTNHFHGKERVKKSLLTPYSVPTIISGIIKIFKMKKASIQAELKPFKWARMDLNHRPSDYESDALTN